MIFRARSFGRFRLLPAPALLLATLLPPGTSRAQSVVGTLTRPSLLPYSVAVYEAGNKVLVGDKATGNLLVYDGATRSLLAEVPISGGAGGAELQVLEGLGKTYFGTFPSGFHIAVVDLQTNALTKYLPLDVGGTARDESLSRIYALARTGAARLYVIDATDDSYETVPLSGAGITTGLGVNPVTHEVFVSYLQGSSLDIVDPVSLTRTTVPGRNGYGQAVNHNQNKVYGARATFDGYWVFDRTTNTLSDLLTDNDATGLSFDPASSRLFSSSEIDAVSSIIDGVTGAIFNLPVDNPAPAPSVRVLTNHVYFAGQTFIGVLDDATQTLEVIPIANPSPSSGILSAVAIDQTRGLVYVVNDADALHAVTVVQDAARLTRPPVYAGAPGSFSLLTLDPASRQVVDGVFPVTAPQQLAVRPGGGRLHAVAQASVGVYAGTGPWAQLGTYGTGGSGMQTVAFSPDGARTFTSNASSKTIGVVDVSTGGLVTTVPVGTTPWGLAVTPDGARIYVANKGDGTVSVVSTASLAVTATVPVGSAPWGVAVNPAGTKAYVANSGSGTVSVIDVASDTVTGTIPVGATPHQLAFSPDGARLFAGSFGAGTVSVIDPGTDAVLATLPVGSRPEGIAALPDGSEIWVVLSSTSGPSSIAVISMPALGVTTFSLGNGSTSALGIAVSDPTARIAGRLTSSLPRGQAATPAPLVTVRALQSGVEKARTASNASGDYALADLLPGTYDVELSGDGTVTQTIPAVVASTGTVTLLSPTVQVVNTAPSITTSPLAREPGRAAIRSTIAVVSDGQSPAGSLVVTVSSAPSGVSVTGIANANGTISADVAVSCGVAPGPSGVTLQVSDGSLTSTDSLSVTVTPDATPPVVTPPAPAAITVDQSTCAGGAGASLATLQTRKPAQYAGLTALLGGGSAVDLCTASPTHLPARLAAADVGPTTLFPIGPSVVQIRFADDAGNVGTATAGVTVLRRGDVDLDGDTDVVDELIVMNAIVGNLVPGTAPFLTPASAGDADEDGDLDVFDVVRHAAFVVGNSSCLVP